MYRAEAMPDSDDEPTLPSIRVCEEVSPPLVAWWRALLGFVLLDGDPS